MSEMSSPLQDYPMGHVRQIHFVGIGGAGMGGIAEVLLAQGYRITGSDLRSNEMTERLARCGAVIYQGHKAHYVFGADVVVYSSAIDLNNPELQMAHERCIPVIARAQMLAELMRFRYGIAVAGSHGKTTTTSLLASILAGAGYDPTYIIGGQLNQINSHAYLGKSHYLIAEADESDASFLYLQPMCAVLTNLDADHLGTYQNDFQKMRETFLSFLHQLPFYGRAVVCIDDPQVKALLPEINRPLLTYGFDEQADIQARHFRQQGARAYFEVCFADGCFEATLNLPGAHNIQNALGSIAVAHTLGVPIAKAVDLLESFSGIARRFKVYNKLQSPAGSVTLIDDYGHHPREIIATVNTIRQGWPKQRIVMVYQPHRYTRTQDLFNDFVQALSQVDQLILLPVYSAGESIIKGADSEALFFAIKQYGKINPLFTSDIHAAEKMLADELRENDIVLMQGAGNISEVTQTIAKKWSKSERYHCE